MWYYIFDFYFYEFQIGLPKAKVILLCTCTCKRSHTHICNTCFAVAFYTANAMLKICSCKCINMSTYICTYLWLNIILQSVHEMVVANILSATKSCSNYWKPSTCTFLCSSLVIPFCCNILSDYLFIFLYFTMLMKKNYLFIIYMTI